MSFPETSAPRNEKWIPLNLEQVLAAEDRFICMDCGIDTNEIREYFMVEDHLWKQNVPEYHGFLCIGCLESRIGRKLDKNDFPAHLPINDPDGFFFPHSDRLRTRLTTMGSIDGADISQS
jgi:hypothetical protein